MDNFSYSKFLASNYFNSDGYRKRISQKSVRTCLVYANRIDVWCIVIQSACCRAAECRVPKREVGKSSIGPALPNAPLVFGIAENFTFPNK